MNRSCLLFTLKWGKVTRHAKSAAKAYKIPYLKPTSENSVGEISSLYFLTAGSVPSVLDYWVTKQKNWELKFEWKDNEEFQANLKFLGFLGDKAVFQNTETYAKFFMRQSALEELLHKGTLIYGTVFGSWKFKKHGCSYSLVSVK